MVRRDQELLSLGLGDIRRIDVGAQHDAWQAADLERGRALRKEIRRGRADLEGAYYQYKLLRVDCGADRRAPADRLRTEPAPSAQR
jgi:hypothetical protein